jgi:hypothetical protein
MTPRALAGGHGDPGDSGVATGAQNLMVPNRCGGSLVLSQQNNDE